jgi:hypothetical protein
MVLRAICDGADTHQPQGGRVPVDLSTWRHQPQGGRGAAPRAGAHKATSPPLCVADHAPEEPRAQAGNTPGGRGHSPHAPPWGGTPRAEENGNGPVTPRGGLAPRVLQGPSPHVRCRTGPPYSEVAPALWPPSKTKDPAGIMDPSRRVQQRNGRCDGAVHNSNRDAHTGDRQGPLGLPPAARPLACAEYKGLVPRVLCQTQFAVPGRRGSLGGLV